MSALAIIPARGGSKRIPRKNVKEFLGKPIIAYSIESCVKSGVFSDVVVSTDCEEIARIATESGAEVPFFRSEKNSDDFATTADVIVEVLGALEGLGRSYEEVCCFYPTAVFCREAELQESFDLLKVSGSNAVISVVEYDHPVQRALRRSGDYISFVNEENAMTRTQDLEELFHDAGQFYWLKTPAFKEEKKLFLDKSQGYFLKRSMVQDIDTLEDWKLAESKYSQYFLS